MFQSKFGKEAPLTITHGKVHEYLGMKINFSAPGKVQFTMEEFVKGVIDEAPDDMKGESPTPAPNQLFTVNTESPIMLDIEESEIFHHITAKLLFLCKRAQPDIQMAVAFLCT